MSIDRFESTWFDDIYIFTPLFDVNISDLDLDSRSQGYKTVKTFIPISHKVLIGWDEILHAIETCWADEPHILSHAVNVQDPTEVIWIFLV